MMSGGGLWLGGAEEEQDARRSGRAEEGRPGDTEARMREGMEGWESVGRALEWGSLYHSYKRAPAIPYFLLARREFILGQRCARW